MMRPQQRNLGRIGRNSDPAPPPPPESGERTLLTASDFTYEGYYILSRYLYHNGGDVFGEGLTHRYVDGQLRLIYRASQLGSQWPQPYREVTIPANFGDNMPAVGTYLTPWLGYWDDILCHSSCWYEEETGRLWSASGYDYPGGIIGQSTTQTLYTRTIEPSPIPGEWVNCENHSGWFGFEGVGSRALFGKVQRVPDSARSQYGFHKYMSLSGGYSSLMAQGLGPALGPMFVSFPELHSNYPSRFLYYEGDYSVPATDFQICGDTRSGTTEADWYAGGYAARNKERGVRLTGVENYMDGGDGRTVPNPSTRPTDTPVLTGNWLSQPTIASVPGDPNGWNRWTWGDSYHGSGCWIDNNAGTRAKHGILMVPMLWAGKVWYMTSSVHRDFSAFEMQVFHPEDLAAVKNGTLDAWKIRPASVWQETNNILTTGNSVGATFDPVSNKLFVAVYGQIGINQFGTEPEAQARVYQYAVAT